ncbi:MAG TPA: 5-oxoprolinase subunit PxpB [Gemmatimonadaceae bacterium]|nr:5-oxoprolinase subunit PxpB [Gemmatimonadaceae bacterium]
MSAPFPFYKPLGDSGLTVVIGEGVSRDLSDRVMRVARALESTRTNGVSEIVPSYASVGIHYDPLEVRFDEVVESVRHVIADSLEGTDNHSRDSQLIRISVRYDGEDLSDVANRTGHSETDVIRLHTEREYYVYVIGFVPGWAYLGDIDPSLVLPRRSVPRKKVPAGSVAIAETQTGVYPFATPGGWHLIGRTETIMFDPHRDEPALLRVGDRVVFERVK